MKCRNGMWLFCMCWNLFKALIFSKPRGSAQDFRRNGFSGDRTWELGDYRPCINKVNFLLKKGSVFFITLYIPIFFNCIHITHTFTYFTLDFKYKESSSIVLNHLNLCNNNQSIKIENYNNNNNKELKWVTKSAARKRMSRSSTNTSSTTPLTPTFSLRKNSQSLMSTMPK